MSARSPPPGSSTIRHANSRNGSRSRIRASDRPVGVGLEKLRLTSDTGGSIPVREIRGAHRRLSESGGTPISELSRNRNGSISDGSGSSAWDERYSQPHAETPASEPAPPPPAFKLGEDEAIRQCLTAYGILPPNPTETEQYMYKYYQDPVRRQPERDRATYIAHWNHVQRQRDPQQRTFFVTKDGKPTTADPEAAPVTHSIEYDAALAAGLLTLELFDENPGAPKYELLSKVIAIVLGSIRDVDRRREENQPILCAGCSRQTGLSKADADKRAACPFCGHKPAETCGVIDHAHH